MSSIDEKRHHQTEEMIEKEDDKISVRKLAWYTHHRDYLRLCKVVGTFVEEHGWQETISLIEEIPIWSETVTHRWAHTDRPSKIGVMPVRRGKLRDGLLRVLNLDGVSGIDVDPLKTFRRIRANDIQSVREQVIPVAFKHLKRQIKEGTTFYLDTEKMLDTSFEKLVPAILDQRKKELLALGDCSTPSKVVATYYGFIDSIRTLTPAEVKVIKALENTPIRERGFRPSYRRTMFKKCSDDLTDLLLNSLRAALAVPQTLERGAVALGVRGDLRANDPLTIGIKRAHQSWRAHGALKAWSKLSWALREVGHPRSECSGY